FAGRPAHALLAAHVTEIPEPILRRRGTLPPALAALVMRCLEKRPADRPQSAAEIVRSLDDISVSSDSVSTHRSAAASPRRRLQWLILLGGAAAVIVLAVEGWFLKNRSPAGDAGAAAKSIAVFPFENASGDTAMAFFADGMAYELSSALSQAGIRVAGRASVAAVQRKHSADQEAGRLLGVETLLHGSVRREGSRLRVWTQLVNSSDGIALWTRTYDTTLTNVFNVQDDLARGIVRELKQSLGGTSQVSKAASRGTDDIAAYDLFMKGRYYTDRFQAERAIKALDDAVAKDPNFARAYAKLARAYGALASGGIVSPDSTRPLEWRAAQRALELDSTLAESHAAMGVALSDEWRFAGAEAAYKRAIALEPDNPDILSGYAALLFSTGHVTESLAQSRHLVELDPLSVNGLTLVQYSLLMLGRLDEARAVTQRGLELDSTFMILLVNAALIAAFDGQPDKALAYSKKLYDLDSTQFGNTVWLLFGYAVAGRWSDVDRLRAKIERDGGGNSPNFFKTMIALVDGDREKAVTYVERAFAAREPLFLFVSPSCDPTFDLIKSEPRYRALMQRYGMRICPPFAKWPVPARTRGR
ncbi:MAG TPA: tetratricopeptide repeat protein, partial [Burkholderiales bacterium]|nr:tetratricopeptide repeat protein [Burkholderiales bacterium]